MSSTDAQSAAATAIQPRRRRRWGLRALGCAILVITALVVSVLQGYHTAGTLGCAVLGVGGAFYCSVRGIRDLLNLEWYRRRVAENMGAEE